MKGPPLTAYRILAILKKHPEGIGFDKLQAEGVSSMPPTAR